MKSQSPLHSEDSFSEHSLNTLKASPTEVLDDSAFEQHSQGRSASSAVIVAPMKSETQSFKYLEQFILESIRYLQN